MKKEHYSASIRAPKEKVWEILWGKDTYPKWTAVFSEGSTAITDWQEGSKVLFVNAKGEGMMSRVAKRKEHEYLSFQHLGMVSGGEEITTGPEVEAWAGAEESYTLTEENGVTKLDVEMDVAEDMLDYFNDTWPKALDVLKELSEN